MKKCDLKTIIPISGCDCIDGYARLYIGGDCVSINDERCKIRMGTTTPTPITTQSTTTTKVPTTTTCSCSKKPLGGKGKTILSWKHWKILTSVSFVECPGRYEIYTIGISPCGNLCANYLKKCNIRSSVTIEGCDCIPGFARLSDGGECVPVFDSRCKMLMSPTTTTTTTTTSTTTKAPVTTKSSDCGCSSRKKALTTSAAPTTTNYGFLTTTRAETTTPKASIGSALSKLLQLLWVSELSGWRKLRNLLWIPSVIK